MYRIVDVSVSFINNKIVCVCEQCGSVRPLCPVATSFCRDSATGSYMTIVIRYSTTQQGIITLPDHPYKSYNATCSLRWQSLGVEWEHVAWTIAT